MFSQSSNKRLNLIKYLKYNLVTNGILLLEKTYSPFNEEVLSKTNNQDQLFFLSWLIKPLWCFESVLESMFFSVKEQATDRNGRILILDATIAESILTEESVLTNF